MSSLNEIQSSVLETALYSAENMLVCAPTGAGKTNVALLSMLQLVGRAHSPSPSPNPNPNPSPDPSPNPNSACTLAVTAGSAVEGGVLQRDRIKMVYVAPMKARRQSHPPQLSLSLSALASNGKTLFAGARC